MNEKDEEFIIKSLSNIMDVLEKIHVWMGVTDERVKKIEDTYITQEQYDFNNDLDEMHKAEFGG